LFRWPPRFTQYVVAPVSFFFYRSFFHSFFLTGLGTDSPRLGHNFPRPPLAAVCPPLGSSAVNSRTCAQPPLFPNTLLTLSASHKSLLAIPPLSVVFFSPIFTILIRILNRVVFLVPPPGFSLPPLPFGIRSPASVPFSKPVPVRPPPQILRLFLLFPFRVQAFHPPLFFSFSFPCPTPRSPPQGVNFSLFSSGR